MIDAKTAKERAKIVKDDRVESLQKEKDKQERANKKWAEANLKEYLDNAETLINSAVVEGSCYTHIDLPSSDQGRELAWLLSAELKKHGYRTQASAIVSRNVFRLVVSWV